MSDLEIRPEFTACTAVGAPGPEVIVLSARKVWLGKTTRVARALPDRQLRMIGAWCFLDHYGPEDVSNTPGMRVYAHPHTGLQTVSWLFEGAIAHADSIGSQALVRPGELNVMTAGHGIVHSELSPPARPPLMHGVQLWVALPEAARDVPPAFEIYPDLPEFVAPGVAGKVMAGTLGGVTAPTRTFSGLAGADLMLAPGASVSLSCEPGFEYGVFVVQGTVGAFGHDAEVDQLIYLGSGRSALQLASAEGARILILGGEPFTEEIVMWWNFIGRSHQEVTGFREEWVNRRAERTGGAARFPAVLTDEEKVMEAPALPTVPLRPRPARQE